VQREDFTIQARNGHVKNNEGPARRESRGPVWRDEADENQPHEVSINS
jgi:hypothetical protein